MAKKLKKNKLGFKLPFLGFLLLTLGVLVANINSRNTVASKAWEGYSHYSQSRFDFSFPFLRNRSFERNQIPEASQAPEPTQAQEVNQNSDNNEIPPLVPTSTSSSAPTATEVPSFTKTTSITTSSEVSKFNDSYSVSTWGRFYITVYYPTAGQKPYPTLVFAPGFMANKEMYTWFGSLMAKNGYVVLIFSPPNIFSPNSDQRVKGITAGIDYVVKQNNNSSSAVYGLVDTEKIAVVGHSAGAMATFIATAQDSRIKTAVFMSPICRQSDMASSPVAQQLGKIADSTSFAGIVESARAIRVPVQIFVGNKDNITPFAAAEYCYTLINETSKEYVEINGADHMGFVSEEYANLVEQLGNFIKIPIAQIRTADISATEQQNIALRYFLPWLNYYLKGDNTAYDQIFGTVANGGLSTGVLSAFGFSK